MFDRVQVRTFQVSSVLESISRSRPRASLNENLGLLQETSDPAIPKAAKFSWRWFTETGSRSVRPKTKAFQDLERSRQTVSFESINAFVTSP
jgi:hypothetical protein